MPTLITEDARRSADTEQNTKNDSNETSNNSGKRDSFNRLEREDKESVQAMEERKLREKLKRKAEDRKSKGTSAGRRSTDSTGSQNLEPSPRTKSEAKEDGGKEGATKAEDVDDSKLKEGDNSNDEANNNGEDRKAGRRVRRGRNRRRRQKRQERNAHANNAANSSAMMDNRTYYSQEHHNGGGRNQHAGGGNYRGGPGGNGSHFQGGGRGPDGPRWEQNGPQYDRQGPRNGYDHGRNGPDYVRGGGNGRGGDPYNNEWDRQGRPGWGAPRGGDNFGPRGGVRGGGDTFPPRGQGRAGEYSPRSGPRGRGGDNFSQRGGGDDGPPRGGGGARGRGRSRSFSRSCSRSSDGSGSYDSSYYSSSSSRSRRTRSRSNSSDASSTRRSSSRSRSRGSTVGRSRSRSRSKSPSQSSSVDPRPNGNAGSGETRPARSTSRSRSSDRHKSQDREDQQKSKKRRREKSDSPSRKTEEEKQQDAITKDQRTIFVSQLVMRAEENEIRKYFRKKCGCKVNEVILLRDRRTGRHKGCAYVELGRLDDVPRAVKFSGVAPSFQRFPILVKASEAEKNYSEKQATATIAIGEVPGTVPSTILGLGEKRIESQKVYIGSIDRNITQAQLYAIFSQFGQLDKVLLQMDPSTGISKGFAFLSFVDPKAANLAIQTMAGQILAGRALRTGWASINPNAHGVKEVTSDEFPVDSAQRVKNVGDALTLLNGTGLTPTAGLALVSGMSVANSTTTNALTSTQDVSAPVSSHITSVAEQAINAALGLSAVPTITSHVSSSLNDPPTTTLSEPTKNILVRNMFDKDTETEDGWEEEIKLDFEEEAVKHGKLLSVKVLSEEVGGKIFASFDTVEAAKACASDLSGRWFDKRQLQVDYIEDGVTP